MDPQTITQYKLQLATVEETLKNASGEQRADLLDLKGKLTEVISLLQGPETEQASSHKNDCLTKSEDHDDEFLRFQMEINELEKDSNSNSNHVQVEYDNEATNDVHEELYKVLSSMEGNKCRAPFIRQWGEKAYHNALIFSTELEGQDIDDLNNVQVKVMFCNPLCEEMKPCPYFLDGHCKFSSEKCRFSHGYSVKYSELEEYILPDYSNVHRDSKCLAKYKDGLWYTAVVENCLKDNKYFVKYDSCGSTDTLAAYDILPLENLSLSDDDSSSESSDEHLINEANIESKGEVLQTTQAEINYMAEIGSSALGTWEQHTKGIGSKLMAKMGYVWGQGLGKNSDGRIEPVEAIVLPKGKSLDKCAEIREIKGEVSVGDKFSAEQVKEQQRVKKLEKTQVQPETVFDFLNKNISGNTEIRKEIGRKRPSSELSSNMGKKSQTSDLNFEMYTVGEDIKKTKKEIIRLQQSLNRNAERNEAACAHMKQKMAIQTSILRRLEAKEQKISNEINQQKNHKKIVTF